MPWKWFGITTYASISTPEQCRGIPSQASSTVLPRLLRATWWAMMLPNNGRMPSTQIVMK